MNKIKLAGILLAASSLRGGDLYWASVAAVGASKVADVRTSWGLHELNPVLGNPTYGVHDASVSIGLTAGLMVAEIAAVHKFPRLRRAFTRLNFVAAGATGAVAAHNQMERK